MNDAPPEVHQAIANLQSGQGTQADKDLLYHYLTSTAVDPQSAAYLQTLLAVPVVARVGGAPGAMSGQLPPNVITGGPLGGPPAYPNPGGSAPQPPLNMGGVTTPTPPSFGFNGADWRSQVQAGVPAAGAAPPAGTTGLNADFMAPVGRAAAEAFFPGSTNTMPPSAAALPPATAALPAVTAAQDFLNRTAGTPGAVPGAGGVVPSPGLGGAPMSEAERQAARTGRQTARGRTGGNEDWRAAAMAFGTDPNSKFFGVQRGAASLFAQDPYLAALQLYGNNPQAAAEMSPEVGGALGLSRLGLLSGHTKKGLGMGPSSYAGQLAQAEQLINALGPGQNYDPGSLYHQAFRRAQNTPLAKFNSGQGQAGDLTNQFQVTKGALLMAAAPYMTQDAANNLSAQIDMAGEQWLMQVGHGDNSMTFPQYLKSIGAGKWVQPGF